MTEAGSEGKPVLEVTGVSKAFGALKAVDDVSLSVNRGDLHALIGPNGAGKSTLIDLMTGWQRPDAGTVTFNGHDVTDASVAKRAAMGLGRSFQVSSLAPELSILDNVLLAAQGRQTSSFRFWTSVYDDESLMASAVEALGAVGWTKPHTAPVSQLSHGDRRQIEVACAMALKPTVLLLDEPAAGLDAEGSRELTEFLATLKGKIPMLLVEHDMYAVFTLADRISVLVNGAIIASGSLDEIQQNEEVRRAYLGDNVHVSGSTC
ncbi:MAG: ABC transporter ATP-binding protein [Pseudomonadota bacterium]